jgi:hypothetical protein
MRKTFFLLAILLMMTGCYDTNSPMLKTISVRVKANEWQYTQQGVNDQFNNNYFYAGFNVPEITARAFDYGEVKAYLVKDRMNATNARKHLLPYVMHKEEMVDGQWIYFTETVDFTYGIGWVEVNFRASDFAYEDNVNINPPAMEFDIVITYPQY